MLFTGDAYDRDCQIQSTVQAFNDTLVTSYVDVLKVSNHCIQWSPSQQSEHI